MRMVVVLTPILENLVGKENGYSIVECIKANKKGFPLMFMRLLQSGKESKEIRGRLIWGENLYEKLTFN